MFIEPRKAKLLEFREERHIFMPLRCDSDYHSAKGYKYNALRGAKTKR